MPREAAQLRAQGIENGLRRRETQGPEKGLQFGSRGFAQVDRRRDERWAARKKKEHF
jgi:hypothetical protein